MEPERILLIRPSALGDVARSAAVLASLRHAFPKAHIAWLLQEGFEDVIRAHPALSEIVPFPRKRLARWWTPKGLRDSFAFLSSLRDRFDLVIDAQGLLRSGLCSWSTRARRRIGFRDARECSWIFHNTRVRIGATERARHAVGRMLALLEGAGIPTVDDGRLYAPPDAGERWNDFARREGVSGKVALLASTSRWASKDWPRASWSALAEALLARGYERVLFTGMASERDAVEAAMPQGRARQASIDLAGRTDLGMTMAAIASSALVISNDSAAMHIAAGLQRPLLGLFGPTDPKEAAPFQRSESIVTSDAARAFLAKGGHYRDRGLGDELMRAISVESVLAAIDAEQHCAGLRACEALA
ncbi:MAG: lipopolysaccharide heptosyltransferase family protein [Phycisphaerales bacterium]|nr:lipopolysaccharide heptosyltransferase family protein [Phycisphaerales bacterium]